ncbi:hypothetical protein [Saccharothrix xinjiangensis]|uniref:Uncharacterized protein n=1 Tax=Saccharothrix xinjiangensis TaxID=204798 RepID=A0ABV9Y0L0_9PSEU
MRSKAARLPADRAAAEPEAVDELVALCGSYPLALAITARAAATRPAIPLTEIAAELRALCDGQWRRAIGVPTRAETTSPRLRPVQAHR